MRCAALVLLILGSLGCASGIRGTYELYLRELPDGTRQEPPDVRGLATWTATHRNFTVYWTDARGNDLSFSYLARYELTPASYAETPLLRIEKRTPGRAVRYTRGGDAGSAPVERVDAGMAFVPPHEDPIRLEFKDGGFVASLEGEFVDHWRRVR